MRCAYRIVNVFTVGADRFSGNPLCVFEDGSGLSDAQMQSLARQLNLSETTFMLPSSVADARVRIFTPGFEMPFAGHPTLGTASVVAARLGKSEVVLEMKAGLVQVTCAPAPPTTPTSPTGPTVGTAFTLRAARAPETRPIECTRAELASMLSLPADAISDEPLWVSTGVEQLVIPVRSADDVRAAKPVPELFARWGFSAARDEAMAYLVARDSDPWTVRFFFTSHGAVVEDPATGSACANLGGYWLATGKPLPLRATLAQGDLVGRPSQLGLEVTTDGAIYVTGAVIELGGGSLEI